jgi:hypothetical protein
MSNFIDLTGQRFGKLVAISRAENGKNNSTRWNCLCDCGNKTVISFTGLIRDRVESCKCEKDLIGNRYGKLKVLEKSDKIYRKKWPLWICQCGCGNVVEVRESSLKCGDIKSCGCSHKDIPRKLLPGVWGFNQVFSRYQRRARRRGINFSLTEEEALLLFKGSCFYCGDMPKQISRPFNDKISTFIYNGIDRIDNFGPYSIENTVSCCGWCNRMKGISTQKDFIDRINNIYANLTKIELKCL